MHNTNHVLVAPMEGRFASKFYCCSTKPKPQLYEFTLCLPPILIGNKNIQKYCFTMPSHFIIED
jgi:hypothetical protein